MTANTGRRRNDLKRGKYAISVSPHLVKQMDELVESGVFRSRSHGFEEGVKLILDYHQARLAERNEERAA